MFRVYVLTDSTSSISKIGWTRNENISERITDYSARSGIALIVYSEFDTWNAAAIEKHAHRHFSDSQIRGVCKEIFAVKPQVVSEWIRTTLETMEQAEGPAETDGSEPQSRPIARQLYEDQKHGPKEPWQIRDFPRHLRIKIIEVAAASNMKVGDLMTGVILRYLDGKPVDDQYLLSRTGSNGLDRAIERSCLLSQHAERIPEWLLSQLFRRIADEADITPVP